MVSDNQHQILLPLQAQQLGRSYNGRLLVNIEVVIRETVNGQVVQHEADVCDLCVGDIPVLVGSVLCHQPITVGNHHAVAYFIVNGQNKVIVSQEQTVV